MHMNDHSGEAGRSGRVIGWADAHVDGLMLFPAVVLLVGLVVLPTLYLFQLGLSRLEVSESTDAVFIGLGNFVHMFTDDPEFLPAIGRSVFFVIVAVPVEFLLGLTMALLMDRRLRGLGILRTLMVMPMAMTPIVAGMTWLILYNPTHGAINYLLSVVGINGPDWTSDPVLALPSIMIVDIWQWTPFMFLVLSAALLTVPQDLLDAARVDGASRWQEFRAVSLPHIRRVGLIAALILLIDSLKTFDSIYALTKGGPGTATQTLNFYAFLQGFQWFHLGYAAALLIVGVGIAALLTWAILKADPDLTASGR
jgi:multiple sugar transport system permease protein